MGFYKILLQIVWHHLSSCNENKAFDNLLASSNCRSFLEISCMRGSRFWQRGCRRGPDPSLPRPCKIGSSLNFHCKVTPGKTQDKKRRTLPLENFLVPCISWNIKYFGLFYYVYLRYLDFQTVGGGGSESPYPLPW